MKIIKETPRKILRYLMFVEKNGVKLENPILGKRKDQQVIKYFESLPEFTSWSDFETLFDIGIGDDLVAKHNRPEKWFLFDYDKSKIVNRPDDYWEKEAVRRKISTHALFTLECHHRGITMNDFFEIFFNRSQEHKNN